MPPQSIIHNPKPWKLPIKLGPVISVDQWNTPICELIRFVARGSFGFVYKGRWQNKTVVVKQIPVEDQKPVILDNIQALLHWSFIKFSSLFPKCCKTSADDFIYKTRLELIENEIKLLSRCKSKYVVQLLDVFLYQSQAWLVTQECLGSVGSLFISKGDCLPQYCLHPDLACYLIFPIFQAVAYLNDLKIMHRDVNLGNILLTKDFIPVLSDFGTAVEFDVEPITDGYALGRSENIAPEIWSIKPYNRTIDTWGVATCVMQLIHIITYFGVISGNPLPIMIEFYTGEYERVVAEVENGKSVADQELHRNLNIQDMSVENLLANRQEAKVAPKLHRWIRTFMRKILVYSISERPSCAEVTKFDEFIEFTQSDRCSRDYILKLAKEHMHENMTPNFYETLDNPFALVPEPTPSPKSSLFPKVCK